MLLRHIPKEQLNATEDYILKTLSHFSPSSDDTVEQLIKIIFTATRYFEDRPVNDTANSDLSLESISNKLKSKAERLELIELLVLAEASYTDENLEKLAEHIEALAEHFNLDDECLTLSRDIAQQTKCKAYEDWIRHNWSTNNKFKDCNQRQISLRFNDAMSEAFIIHSEDEFLIQKNGITCHNSRSQYRSKTLVFYQ